MTMSKERERIIVKMVNGDVYEGSLSLHGRIRVVDTLNHPEPFFNLRRARLTDGEEIPLIVLAKDQVVSVQQITPPAEEIQGTTMLRKGEGRIFQQKK